jgi:hypothetical protein
MRSNGGTSKGAVQVSRRGLSVLMMVVSLRCRRRHYQVA